MMPDLLVSHAIPYRCQYASRELVRAFVNGERALESDPRWAAYGADTPEEYAHWAARSCGVVCVKMVADGLGGVDSGTVMDWVRAGLAIDGYLAELRPDRSDKPVEKGWKHVALAHMLIEAGHDARLAAGMGLDEVVAHIRADRVIVASVSSELGENGSLTRSSGHLVVVFGVAVDGRGRVRRVIVHNPSGRTKALQEGARIAARRFAQGFSGRGIVVGRAVGEGGVLIWG
jgi:hypothetical protein